MFKKNKPKKVKCICKKESIQTVDIRVYCANCDIEKKVYSIKSPYKVALICAVIGFSGSNLIEYGITDNRFPIEKEYVLLNTCINSNEVLKTRSAYTKKEELCFCALQESMNEISSIREDIQEEYFLEVFSEKVNLCM